MSKQLLIHSFPAPIPIAEAEGVAKGAKALSNVDAYWVSAWIQLDDKGNAAKIICEWDAKDVESVNKVVEQIHKQMPDFPCDGPYPMMKVDGESYR